MFVNMHVHRNGQLIEHMLMHYGEKPCHCDVCQYACNMKSSQFKPKRIHTGEEPYNCDYQC